jgi:hypothetical protein
MTFENLCHFAQAEKQVGLNALQINTKVPGVGLPEKSRGRLPPVMARLDR